MSRCKKLDEIHCSRCAKRIKDEDDEEYWQESGTSWMFPGRWVPVCRDCMFRLIVEDSPAADADAITRAFARDFFGLLDAPSPLVFRTMNYYVRHPMGKK